MRVILHTCCQIQGTISGLRYANSGPGQIQYNYSSSYAGLNIQLNVSLLRLVIYRQQKRIMLHICCEIQGTAAGLRNVNSGTCQVQY
jgi:hypothetical protein